VILLNYNDVGDIINNNRVVKIIQENFKYMADIKKIEWEESYSVGVKIIDNQHKKFFDIINNLISVLGRRVTEGDIKEIIDGLIAYTEYHFATEEKYFKDFNFEGAAEHIKQHQLFREKVAEIQKSFGDDLPGFAFGLADLLEDWLIDHIMTMDQQYKNCFISHGLK